MQILQKRKMEIQTKKDKEKPIVELSNIIEAISNYRMEVRKMKRKMVVLVVALLMLASVALPISEARAAIMNADGYCFISPSGKSVSFGGSTSSAGDEDEIRVTVVLYEKRSGKWYEIARVSKTDYDTDYVEKSTTITVSGGYYYKATSSHYTRTGTVTCSSSGSTSECWIPA